MTDWLDAKLAQFDEAARKDEMSTAKWLAERETISAQTPAKWEALGDCVKGYVDRFNAPTLRHGRLGAHSPVTVRS